MIPHDGKLTLFLIYALVALSSKYRQKTAAGGM
jgi:hypothetical protein